MNVSRETNDKKSDKDTYRRNILGNPFIKFSKMFHVKHFFDFYERQYILNHLLADLYVLCYTNAG